MYIDKSAEIKIRHRTTGEIKTAYQGHKPWLIVDKDGTEIMADWEVCEEVSVLKSITAVSSSFLITGLIYWVCFSDSFYLRVIGLCDACK
jgi:hypothetical protein